MYGKLGRWKRMRAEKCCDDSMDFCCWWKYERGGWTLQPNQSSNLVSYLQTCLTSRLFISCNFLLSDQQCVSSLEVKITQLNKKHLIDRFHREAGEHPLQSPMSRSKSICAIDSHPTSGETAQIDLYRCTVRQVRQVRLTGTFVGHHLWVQDQEPIGTHFQKAGPNSDACGPSLVLGGDHEASVSQELLGRQKVCR